MEDSTKKDEVAEIVNGVDVKMKEENQKENVEKKDNEIKKIEH